MTINWYGHSCFRLDSKGLSVLIDPFSKEIGLKPPRTANDNIFLVTHEHYDHCDKSKIKQLIYEGTHIIASEGCEGKLLELDGKISNEIVILGAGEESNLLNIKITAFPAYNLNKNYHLRGSGVGYVLEMEGKKLYFSGDTDFIPEMKNFAALHIDAAFVPVGGKYTMNAVEAAEAVKVIKPKIAVPMHYGKIIGGRKDAEKFRRLVGSVCKVVVMGGR